MWAYSNVAYTLLGNVVERVSGRSYAEYLHENILSPCRMEGADVGDTEPALAKAALAYWGGEARDPLRSP